MSLRACETAPSPQRGPLFSVRLNLSLLAQFSFLTHADHRRGEGSLTRVLEAPGHVARQSDASQA